MAVTKEDLKKYVDRGDFASARALLRESLSRALENQLPTALNVEPLPIVEAVIDDSELEAERNIVNEIGASAQQLGADGEIEYEEGVIGVCFTSKQAAADFSAFLEAHEAVDTYEIAVYSEDEVEEDSEIDFDDIEGDNNTIEFIVYLKPEYVSYGVEDLELDEDEELYDENGQIYEVKRIIKINFRGKRRIKMQCRKGFKWNPETRSCQKITGQELAQKRKAMRKMVRTRKSLGAGFRRRVLRKRRKAMRFRKSMGMSN